MAGHVEARERFAAPRHLPREIQGFFATAVGVQPVQKNPQPRALGRGRDEIHGEPRFARWTVGAEATLIGLPPTVAFEQAGPCYAPAGFTPGRSGPPQTFDPGYRTYLDWDYGAAPYDGGDGSRGGRYGPGSVHAGVVNHLFVDGHAESINGRIDPAAYMFVITRDGGDPADGRKP